MSDDRLRSAIHEAYECLTRLDDLGPDTSESAVEAARMVLAAAMVDPGEGAAT